jgi:acyl-CoA synthetase (NDP forming)
VLSADLRHPEHLRALIAALARTTAQEAPSPPKPRVDRELVERVREEIEHQLSDHDAKRLLKAYGARVTRQAPTATPTGAAKLARTIGLPVELVSSVGPGGEPRLAETLPEARRIASLLLQAAGKDGLLPSVMVRERFPEAPRARVRVTHEKGLGLVLRVGEACALLPVSRAEALELAAATPARRAPDQRAVAELLGKISACAAGEAATFELEVYVGTDPAVLTAAGELRRP